jgi:hypothetical protein
MFVRWRDRPKKLWRGSGRLSAILVESARVGGKPRQRYVAFLAGFDYGPAWPELEHGRRRSFWRQADAVLAAKVRRLSKRERAAHDRRLAEIGLA